MTHSRTRRAVAVAALGWGLALGAMARGDGPGVDPAHLFDRDNLIAWCIVPFDGKKRGPEARAAMLARLGFRHFAYDWRAEHVPTFDAEVDALAKHKVGLDAFWCPGELNAESKAILDLLKRRGVQAELWVDARAGQRHRGRAPKSRRSGSPRRAASSARWPRRRARSGATWRCTTTAAGSASRRIRSPSSSGCTRQGVANVGMVYNLHHAQPQLGRLAATLKATMPYLRAINLDGVDAVGEPGRGRSSRSARGRWIWPPPDDPRLGVRRADRHPRPHRRRRRGAPAGQPRRPRLARPAARRQTRRPPARPADPRPAAGRARRPGLPPGEAATVAALLADARRGGDVGRGAALFASSRLACLGCHKVAGQGGVIGPDLSALGVCVPPEEIVGSVLWPQLQVKAGYEAVTLALPTGPRRRGTSARGRPPSTPWSTRDRSDHPGRPRPGRGPPRRRQPDARRALASLPPADRRDLVRFLIGLGRPEPTPPACSPAPGRRDRRPVPPRPAPAPPRPPPRLATPRQPRPRLRLLRQAGRLLPAAEPPAAPPGRLSRPRRRRRKATGGTRTRRPGRNDAGTGPTWARSSRASSAGRASRWPRASASASATAASWPSASTRRP